MSPIFNLKGVVSFGNTGKRNITWTLLNLGGSIGFFNSDTFQL